MGQCASNASGKTLTTSTITDAKAPQSIDTQKVIPTAVSSAEGANSPINNTSNGANASSIVPSLAQSSLSGSYNEQSLPIYKQESKEETSANTNETKITVTSAQPSGVPSVIVTPADAASNTTSSPKEDDEWRLAVKNILCSVLERLLEIVDNEREPLVAVLSQLNLPNVIHLFNGKQFEALLRETFVLPSLEPTVPITNPQYDELRLGLFLSVLRSSSASAPTSTSTTVNYQSSRPTRQQMAVSLVKLCQSTQQQLFTAANLTKDSNLQRHLLFFARAFTFATRTDIVNRIEALYENIDQVIAAS